jgi:hypothetical protein
MMSRCRVAGVLAALAAFGLLDASQSHGQQARRYRPRTPTVSPYLNLLRREEGDGLPNYYSLVRPQLQQQAFNNQQQQFNQQQLILSAQQSAAIGALSTQLQPTLTPTGKASGFMTTGSGVHYQNTSRFFPRAGRRR